ncbi:MAG: alpha/beta fold hydrolase [Chloroflexi bacterium]|nr:alpha/beta fold hydrolase [Chloroflexota bacterium]
MTRLRCSPLLVSTVLIFWFVACSSETTAPTPPARTNTSASVAAITAVPTVLANSVADLTTRPAPTSTATFTPPLAPTQTPPPTPTPLNPLMISEQRKREYSGSEITIEQKLAPGANYDRYLASYLSDGLKIYALLTVPRGEKPASGFPVIIFNHGFIQPAQYRTTERYVDYVDRLARSGYIVFRSDYRGHGSSEGEARGGYGSPDYTIDVLNAVASIKKYADADPQRIGMWGHSMGGYIALRAMVIDSDIKAASIWAGVVASYPDLLARWRRPNSGSAPAITPSTSSPGRRWRTELIEQYGTPEENPEFWDSISANRFLNELSAPIQLHHGTADTSVPVEFSKILYDQILGIGRIEFAATTTPSRSTATGIPKM